MADDQIREQLALYALGALSQHEARAVDRHLGEGCEVCQAELEPFESVVAALGFAGPLESPPPSVREQLVSRLSEESQAPVVGTASMRDGLNQFYSLRADQGEWLESSPGLLEKQLFVDENKGTVTTLIKMLPGVKLPSHRHLGIEECLVLEGDFHVNGKVFGPGDYRCAMAGSIDQSPYSVDGTLLLILAQGGYELLAQ